MRAKRKNQNCFNDRVEFSEDHRNAVIDGISLRLSSPDTLNMQWVGQSDLLVRLLAAWTLIDDNDVPLNPRLVGRPGVGKTTLAYAAARKFQREVFLLQATMDTRPEDLIVTPVVGESQQIQYVASPLVTAMLLGGVCILDEGNRMSEKAWASLAPLLDARRYVESIITGIKIPAHPDFRFCATMNDDSSTYELPEYIHSRLQPQIRVEFPDSEEEMFILKKDLPFVKDNVAEYVLDFLRRAHDADEFYTVRDGINIARYASRLLAVEDITYQQAVQDAIEMTLGSEALAYV